jgi:DNA recombination protein RmuC
MTEIILLTALLTISLVSLTILVIAIKRGVRAGQNGGLPNCGVTPDELQAELGRVVNELDIRVRQASDGVIRSVEHNLTVGNSAVQTGISAQLQTVENSVRKVSDDERALSDRMRDLFGALTQQTETRLDKFREDMTRSLNEVRSGSANDERALSDRMRDLFGTLTQQTEARLDKFREDMTRSLSEVRSGSAADLKAMREVVDEKLSSTLESRFKTSFSMISERLEEINKSFSELQNLQTGVRDLNRYFGNVKTRGTWGEISLENLLSQILEAGQYETQKSFGRSPVKVDFAIRLPGRGAEEVFLPIDAKFPTESYQRLTEISETGGKEATDAASKAFLSAIETQARSVRDKYIHQPYTTDFAIIYLPVEGMFAEVVKSPGMQERLQEQYRIVVAGPTTLAALLNSLQMGFRTVALEKRNAEIRKLFESFKKDFVRFSDLLGKTLKQLGSITKSIEEADKRTEMIRQKLNKVSAIPVPGEETPPETDETEMNADSAFDLHDDAF